VLARVGQRFKHAYFPLSGMISVVALLPEGLGAEVATVGNEGMMGLPILFGSGISPFHVMGSCPAWPGRVSGSPSGTCRSGD
jgi:hypothetical protein